jgi:hypothetical protein
MMNLETIREHILFEGVIHDDYVTVKDSKVVIERPSLLPVTVEVVGDYYVVHAGPDLAVRTQDAIIAVQEVHVEYFDDLAGAWGPGNVP